MIITREELNPCTIRLSITVDPEQVREGFEKAYRQLSKGVRVPGFRPGQAPKAIVEPMIPKDQLYDAAADIIVRRSFKEAIDSEALEPHPNSRPSVDLKALEEESGRCEFDVKVPLAPKVELAEYRGLSAQKPKVEVTEEDIDAQIEELRKSRSTREAVTDRGVEEGDVAVLNVRIDGEEGEGRNFMTVAGKTFPELDAALLGMRVEEVKSVELPFPANFQEKDWAGKTLKAVVTVRSLSAVQLPELDDTFAQSMRTGSVDELRQRVREVLTHARTSMSNEYVNHQLIENLVQKSTIHVPDTMWEDVANNKIRQVIEEQREKGKTLDQYAAEQGMTVDEFRASQEREAKMYIVRAVAVQEIYLREKMELTPADLNAELYEMAREYQLPPEEMFNLLKKNKATSELRFRAMDRKVLDFLRENANLVEFDPAQA
ncbi:MAG: trigger factor [Fimbriimonadaceae bacterium]